MMMNTINRVQRMILATDSAFDLTFSGWDNAVLVRCNAQLKEYKIEKVYYENRKEIQLELLEDERFAPVLKKLIDSGVSTSSIHNLVKAVQSHGERMADYAPDRLIQTLKFAQDSIAYLYLRYFSGRKLKDRKLKAAQRETVCQALETFCRDEAVFDQLDDTQREYLLNPLLLECRLFPFADFLPACELFQQDQFLLDTVQFLFDHGFTVGLGIEAYKAIHEQSKSIYHDLQAIYEMMQYKQDSMHQFCIRWVENGCLAHDLTVWLEKLPQIGGEQINNALDNRAAYVNFIYDGNSGGIPLNEIRSCAEELLIYAIAHSKRGFLKLVEENFDTFQALPSDSLLFQESLYRCHFNLNTLNAKNLGDCVKMRGQPPNLLENRVYAFQEIKLLYGLSKKYSVFYHHLAIDKLDDRLLVLQQLAKKELLDTVIETDFPVLAQRLSIKPLYHWIEQDFSAIEGLTPIDAISLLIHMDEIERFLPQITTKEEARYLIRNAADIGRYASLVDVKKNILYLDKAWGELRRVMKLDDAFIKLHCKQIESFLLLDGAQIALTYYHNLSEQQKNAYLLVVKAELIGRLPELKYFGDDLKKEISYPISRLQKNAWVENLSLNQGSYFIQECDDFFSTMLLGEKPYHTCLSYISGSNNECLLSSFDSNKKILYAYLNDKLVARAFIRLTKGSYHDPINQKHELEFTDLEDLKEKTNAQPVEKQNEHLTLFLERTYNSGITKKEKEEVNNLFYKLVCQKAENLGALPMFCGAYVGGMIRTTFFMYISRSKAGAQYLDSFGGHNGVSDEDTYKMAPLYSRPSDVAALS